MAGSYEHLRLASAEQTEGVRIRSGVCRVYGGVDTSLIENMRDAIEAMTHMYWMIQILANGNADKIRKASRHGIEIEADRAQFTPADEVVNPMTVSVAHSCSVRFCHECGTIVTHEKPPRKRG